MPAENRNQAEQEARVRVREGRRNEDYSGTPGCSARRACLRERLGARVRLSGHCEAAALGASARKAADVAVVAEHDVTAAVCDAPVR